jgi:trehalose synthase
MCTITERGGDVKKAGSSSDPLWFKDAVIYELHVRAFADGNNDGIGDFAGLLGKLDYLQDLGITCLWLLPFYPSPLRDDGYDISDYTNIHPNCGTLDDFRRFLDAAHARGMQVLTELVLNHTSDQHPWFQRARRAPSGSPEREFYVWSDNSAKFSGVRIIFSDTETSNWTWDPVAKAYFWHRFFSHQPDLNFDNPEVLREMLGAMRFWLDMGVDALRLDAIPYLVEREGTSCENLPETHAIVKQLRAEVDAGYSNRFVLAEANQWPSDVRPYFGDGDECQMAFHFPLMPRIYVAIRQEDCLPIAEIMAQTPEIPSNCQWGLFLRNHDELTLEMVTEDERDYMYLAYSADPRMRLNLGIRRRLAPLLENNRLRFELLNSLLFSFPGTPILYYGDEIGMGDNIELGDRNGVRTPMQWNSARNAGFSAADPEKLYSPVIDDPVYGYQVVNVKEQIENPASLLRWMRKMIGLRKLFGVFGRGTFRILPNANRKVLAYIRQYRDQTVLCVANVSRSAQPVLLDLDEYEDRTPVEMLGYVAFPKIARQPYFLSLTPYAFMWFELQAASTTADLSPGVRTDAPEEWDLAVADLQQTHAAATESIRAADSLSVGQAGEEARPPVVEVQEGSPDLLIVATPTNREELDVSIAAVVARLGGSPSPARTMLAFPSPDKSIPGEAGTQAPQLVGGAPWLQLSPFASSPVGLARDWPHTTQSYLNALSLMEEHHARAAILLSNAVSALDPMALPSLARCILDEPIDLVMPRYLLDPHEGLLNNAILYPLTRALYRSSVRFPLGGDVAFSAKFAQALGLKPNGVPFPGEGEIVWPVPEALRSDSAVAEAPMKRERPAQAETADISATFTRVVGSLFSDIEWRAREWQTPHRFLQARRIRAAAAPEPASAGPAAPVDVTQMIESFRLGGQTLNEIWAQAMTPRTLLAVMRLAAGRESRFSLPNALWVRIVYDFLIAHREQTMNRNHLMGALMPLYLGWTASHLTGLGTEGESAAEQRIEALAAAFEADKPYLLARWRWPDNFNP